MWSKKLCFLLYLVLFAYPVVKAQGLEVDKDAPVKNLKLVREEDDGKGHIIRTVQYSKGNVRVTETIFITKGPAVTELHVPIRPDTLVKNLLEIVVSKSSYRVGLYYRNRLIRSYKAVFGPNPKFNKLMEGDRNTPEGKFTITNKNPASKYNKFMLLSYPNDSAYARFNMLKKQGKIPADARIGGDIGIHGIWKGGDDMIEMGVGWTDGCVAIKNKDIEELFSLVGVGTKVTIRR
ncbi:L,D-transpeptidase [Rurimicrobium arvi]|uniref:L,D-TPase catalytic domain-containing protein n=1 Tax=Rurimicrobium arvi TaxID=2049916 RepID=A0ABP8MNT9_9BACT